MLLSEYFSQHNNKTKKIKVWYSKFFIFFFWKILVLSRCLIHNSIIFGYVYKMLIYIFNIYYYYLWPFYKQNRTYSLFQYSKSDFASSFKWTSCATLINKEYNSFLKLLHILNLFVILAICREWWNWKWNN